MDELPIAIGDGKEIRVFRIPRADQIHRNFQEAFQFFLQTEEAIGKASAIAEVKFVEEIDVARAGVEIPRRGRAKDVQPPHAISAAEHRDLPANALDKIDHHFEYSI